MKKALSILFFLYTHAATAQVAQPSLLWLYEIGGNGGTAVATNVTATNDSGFIILYGTLATTGPIDSLCSEPDPTNVFQKYNANASVLEWTKCYNTGGGGY